MFFNKQNFDQDALMNGCEDPGEQPQIHTNSTYQPFHSNNHSKVIKSGYNFDGNGMNENVQVMINGSERGPNPII